MNKSNDMLGESLTGSRRKFLLGASVAAGALAVPRGALGQGTQPAGPQMPSDGDVLAAPNHTLIYVYLRGGADGLSFLAPIGDSSYSGVRPSLAMANPISLPSVNLSPQNGMPSYWGLSPALGALAPSLPNGNLGGAYGTGRLALIPAIGQMDNNKSHFVAQDRMEFGLPPASQNFTGPPVADGFIARHLANTSFSMTPALRGIVKKKLATVSFLRADRSLAIPDLKDFSFPGDPLMRASLDIMNEFQPNSTHEAAHDNAMAAVDYLANFPFSTAVGSYPVFANGPMAGQITPLGNHFREAADLIKAGMAPEVIEIDLGGWDTHFGQLANTAGAGGMYDLMKALGDSLAGFYDDLSGFTFPGTNIKGIDRSTVVTVSEFGRRVAENGTAGTDHGNGGLMMAMGGRVKGGIYDIPYRDRSLMNPGMSALAAATNGAGDLDSLSDYRDVFAEAFTRMMGLGDSTDVYLPGFATSTTFSGLFV